MSELILKEIIELEKQGNIYVIKNDEGVFLYRKKDLRKYSVKIVCRRVSCSKILKLKPIHNVR